MKMIDMTCPKCGATMKPDLDKGKAVCEYCGHHILIEKEDSIEEIRAKAESRSYGYHKGKLKAEAEAQKKKKQRSVKKVCIAIAVVFALVVISGMMPELSKPKVDPFACIEVSFQGKDGDGEIIVDLVNTVEGIDANRIDYDISKKRNLQQGESVTISASSYDYRLTGQSRTYTVEGLDEYLTEPEDIPQEALELIHTKAESVLDTNLKRTKDTDVFIGMEPVKLFLETDGKQMNRLYDVFEAHFMTNDGEQIYYVLTYFDDVVVRDGAQVSIDMSSGMYLGHLTQVQGSLFIMAYDTLDEVRVDILTSMESDMELKELELQEATRTQ